MMSWYQNDEEEEDLMFSPALMARRASESWIDTPPIEVITKQIVLETTTSIKTLMRRFKIVKKIDLNK